MSDHERPRWLSRSWIIRCVLRCIVHRMQWVEQLSTLLKALDLTYLQYIVMMVLWEEKEINVKALGAKNGWIPGTLTHSSAWKRKVTCLELAVLKMNEFELLRDACRGRAQEQAQTVPVEMLCLSKMNENELKSLKHSVSSYLVIVSKRTDF